jgi:SAM-dependent methyltransferase
VAHDPAQYGDVIASTYDERFAPLTSDDPAINFLVEHAGGGPALELGIGTGRFAVPLASRGIVVHGIDTSKAMVERMRRKSGGDRIVVTMGDFRDVPAPGRDYRLVFVVFNTFFGLLTQDDQVAAFRATAERLRPGGRFVLDAFVPDLSRFDRGQRLATQSLVAGGVRIEASVLDLATQRVDTNEVTIVEGRTTTLPISIRFAWPSELDLMARLAGLALEARYSSWSKAPFGSWSKNHVSVYRKPPA